MPRDTDTQMNQTSKTINFPEPSDGIENSPDPGQKPGEHVPPVEVPGREETPEHVPEKSRQKPSDANKVN